MFNTAGAITLPAREAVRADTHEERGVKAENERAMDQVLADSFPASDPPPWTLGVSQRHSGRPDGIARVSWSLRDRVPEGRPPPWDAITDVVIVSSGTAAQRTMNQWRATVTGSMGVALLFPIAILIIGVPIVLALRGIAEAVAWLAALMLK